MCVERTRCKMGLFRWHIKFRPVDVTSRERLPVLAVIRLSVEQLTVPATTIPITVYTKTAMSTERMVPLDIALNGS